MGVVVSKSIDVDVNVLVTDGGGEKYRSFVHWVCLCVE